MTGFCLAVGLKRFCKLSWKRQFVIDTNCVFSLFLWPGRFGDRGSRYHRT